MLNIDVEELLSRGVETLIDPNSALLNKLKSNPTGVVIKLGVDPTRPDIHLGHAVILRRLRQFQDIGAKVIFLIGDVTAQIGDPTGKSKVRPEITLVEVQKNMKTFLDQVGKILSTDPKVFSWITNSEWFVNITDLTSPTETKLELEGKPVDPNSFMGKALLYENTRIQKSTLHRDSIVTSSLLQFLSTLKGITHSRLIARDMFQDRIEKGEELYMHEMMYPVLQGIDSAMIARIYGSCDLEIGGTDQTFNMLMGRDVMKMNHQPEQSVMALDILPGLDGKEKMSKSLDNYISIIDEPNDMYGKVMSIPDTSIVTYFKLATYTPLAEVEKINKDLEGGKGNPKEIKMRLARQIVAEYHGEDASKKAEENFVETFSKGGIPEDIETVKASVGDKLSDILLSQGVVESKSEWRRLVEDGAVKNADGDTKISSPDAIFENPIVLKVGKRRFIKIEGL